MVHGMSDPVPNDEADGVLSSIRRLVAEKPAVSPANPVGVMDGDRSAGADRFVLTDALRVAECAPEGPRVAVSRDPGPRPDGAQAGAPHPNHEERPATPVVLTGPTFAAPDDQDGSQDMEDAVTPLVRGDVSCAVDRIVMGADLSGRGLSEDGDGRGHPERAPAGAPLPLNEDALRRLVADIVRTELQGALGERITRNVRKLVRREIHRALLSQNID